MVEKILDRALKKNAIQNRMEQVRRDLDEDVQDTVEGVRELGDWRSYVKAILSRIRVRSLFTIRTIHTGRRVT